MVARVVNYMVMGQPVESCPSQLTLVAGKSVFPRTQMAQLLQTRPSPGVGLGGGVGGTAGPDPNVSQGVFSFRYNSTGLLKTYRILIHSTESH